MRYEELTLKTVLGFFCVIGLASMMAIIYHASKAVAQRQAVTIEEKEVASAEVYINGQWVKLKASEIYFSHKGETYIKADYITDYGDINYNSTYGTPQLDRWVKDESIVYYNQPIKNLKEGVEERELRKGNLYITDNVDYKRK